MYHVTVVIKCPVCGEANKGLRCPSCGAQPSQGVDQVRDQAASNRDRTAEHRDRAAERRDRGAEDRDEHARQGELAASDQDQAWSDRDQTASGGDQRAADHDQRAADDDQHAANDDFAAGGDTGRHTRGLLARAHARSERGSASVSREETSAARLQSHDEEAANRQHMQPAGHDREEAADDRKSAAHDRKEAAGDREAALRNRTESAAAAHRALETLESMSDAFFTLDPAWRFTYLNPQAEAILKRRREDLLGTNIWTEFPEWLGSPFDDAYRRALREQVLVRFADHYEPLGRTLEIRAYPVTGGLAVYFTDVTDEHLRDQRLRQAQRLEAIGRVTAGVAHDFNNLLTAVGGFARLGQAIAPDTTSKSYFDQIDSASQTAVALTRQLLVFSREQVLAPVVVDLNDVVEGLSSVLRQLLPAGIDLQLKLSPEPVRVFVDRSQLDQVLLNLVMNSRDAIDTNGSITVSTRTDEPVGVAHNVRIASGWLQVADTGAGIPADMIPLIFDPFFSTKPPDTGTGLGLATIYGIVSQSGGSIFVDSTPHVGTTMTLALPADNRSGPPPTP
jgi:signal transduction histidine kinase